MNIPLRMPFQERRQGNMHVQKQGLSCGANVFPARSFVKLDGGGLLAAVATAGIAVYGWAPAASVNPAVEQPPNVIYKLCYPFDISEGSQFVINIAAGGVVGDTGAQLADVIIGGQYGIFTDANGFQTLNTADTTNGFFKVVGIYPNMAATDRNPLVLAEVIASRLQA